MATIRKTVCFSDSDYAFYKKHYPEIDNNFSVFTNNMFKRNLRTAETDVEKEIIDTQKELTKACEEKDQANLRVDTLMNKLNFLRERRKNE